jgi:hypothetical protein
VGLGLDQLSLETKNNENYGAENRSRQHMGKRKMVNFAKAGFPHYEEVEEEGMPKPCAMGIPWVNPDTLKTLQHRNIRRTGPKGEPLDDQATRP